MQEERAMEITVSTENGRVPVTIVRLQGDLDSSNYMELQERTDQLIAGGVRHILLDFSETKFISSAGFRVIQHLFNELRARSSEGGLSEAQVRQGIREGTYTSPHLKVLNLSKESQKAFEMTGFDMYIETYNDLKKAVASF
jgi:anti-anti-sigma factor